MIGAIVSMFFVFACIPLFARLILWAFKDSHKGR